jgi:endoglucanase
MSIWDQNKSNYTKSSKAKLIVLFMLIFYNSYIFSNGLVNRHGLLKVEGTSLVDKKGSKFTLRGVSLGWSNEHYRFYNESVVNWLKKDWNVSVVRATVGVEPENGYLDAPLRTTSQICEVIDGAIKNDIYIIVAWHCNNMHLRQSKDFFAEVAKKYGGHPNIIYEIFTEPDNESWPELKLYYKELVSEIRKYDKQNIILVSAPYWTQQIKEVADDPLQGYSNIMYTVHFCVGESEQKFRSECNYALEKGIPIMVSDHLLTNCSCNGNLFIDEWDKWLFWFEQNNISWLAWSISDKNESCSMLLPTANSNGNWTVNDISISGSIVRNKLRNYKK